MNDDWLAAQPEWMKGMWASRAAQSARSWDAINEGAAMHKRRLATLDVDAMALQPPPLPRMPMIDTSGYRGAPRENALARLLAEQHREQRQQVQGYANGGPVRAPAPRAADADPWTMHPPRFR